MKQKTWNHQVVKKKNKEIVLGAITALAPISRADIAQRSGLNKATVSSLINELIDEELIYESGPGESSGGRRPVILLFNEQAGYSIGMDIGVNYILGVVTDLVGNIIYEENEAIDHLSFQELIDLVKKMIQGLIDRTPKSRYGVIGIGIGVPGIVDKYGKVLLAPNLKWKDVNLLDLLEQEFDYPIFIENEANAGAYGEKRFGERKERDNLIYVSVGIGIGVGIILENELYRGVNGYSGESGHMTIMVNGELCTCGSTGCWEAYGSEHALLKEAKHFEHLSHSTLDELIQMAESKDADTLELFRKIGTYIGIGVTNLIKTFNPGQIIIGNRLAKAKDFIEKPIVDTVQKQTLHFHQTDMKIQFSNLSLYAAALGVSAFAVDNFLKIDESHL
ncbi:ROK family protein [Jeotgalibacillus marinus]|uniref:ROK family transcriptional regulator n=1 Tax=Jeotgalibacillus marinus TaxID=86667 RepID=A0ABV3Q310_9BACL